MRRSTKAGRCIRRGLAGVIAAAGLAGSATLAVAQGDHERLHDAWHDLISDQEPILSESQFAQLNNLAYQAAVTRVCDGYELDQDAFAQGLAEAMAEEPVEADNDEIRHWEAAVLFRLGATYGLFLAEGNTAPDGFCANAAEVRDDDEVPHYWQ